MMFKASILALLIAIFSSAMFPKGERGLGWFVFVRIPVYVASVLLCASILVALWSALAWAWEVMP